MDGFDEDVILGFGVRVVEAEDRLGLEAERACGGSLAEGVNGAGEEEGSSSGEDEGEGDEQLNLASARVLTNLGAFTADDIFDLFAEHADDEGVLHRDAYAHCMAALARAREDGGDEDGGDGDGGGGVGDGDEELGGGDDGERGEGLGGGRRPARGGVRRRSRATRTVQLAQSARGGAGRGGLGCCE